MGIRVGIITEGAIDDALLPPLLQRIAQDQAGFTWPVPVEDQADFLPTRKRGHGGVLDGVRNIVQTLAQMGFLPHGFFIALLDYKTEHVQEEIDRIIAQHSVSDRIFVAVAIREIEAWWLGDRTSTLGWFRLSELSAAGSHYCQPKYKAETDSDPKATLRELIDRSDHIREHFGDHYIKDMAVDFGEAWKDCANLEEIKSQCPKGFKPFCAEAARAFKRELAKQKGR